MRTTSQTLAATALLASFAFAPLALAQSTAPSTSSTEPGVATGTAATPGTAVAPPSTAGVPAGSPDVTPATPMASTPATGNPAIHTDSTAASTPASGATSFTMKQAKYRLMHHGFTDVTDLKKDHHGVWNASAMKDGSAVKAWLDFKGNVGTR